MCQALTHLIFTATLLGKYYLPLLQMSIMKTENLSDSSKVIPSKWQSHDLVLSSLVSEPMLSATSLLVPLLIFDQTKVNQKVF